MEEQIESLLVPVSYLVGSVSCKYTEFKCMREPFVESKEQTLILIKKACVKYVPI